MNRSLVLALAAMIAAAPAAGAFAQTAPDRQTPPPAEASTGQQTFDMRDDASAWINDPHVHQFYQLTIDAFAQGPDHLDRAAYVKRFHEIFDDFADAHHIPREHLRDHLKAIPGEMILIVTRDPHTLDSYDNFVVSLFGPQPQKSAPAPGPG